MENTIWGWVFGGSGIAAVVYTLAMRISTLEKQVQALTETLDRVRYYLHEIDPSLEDERELMREVMDDARPINFAPMQLIELQEQKRARGQRTLRDPL